MNKEQLIDKIIGFLESNQEISGFFPISKKEIENSPVDFSVSVTRKDDCGIIERFSIYVNQSDREIPTPKYPTAIDELTQVILNCLKSCENVTIGNIGAAIPKTPNNYIGKIEIWSKNVRYIITIQDNLNKG